MTARTQRPLQAPGDAARLVGQAVADDTLVGFGSRFFEVRGRLRLDRAVIETRTLVQREGLNVTPLQHRRGALDVPSAAT